jgi:hypothetical protein
MMRRSLIVGVAVLFATASVAFAQGQGQRGQGQGQRGQGQGGQGQGQRGQGFGGPGGGVTGLLAMPEVLKEIGVSDDQKGLIADMLQDLRPAGGGNRQDSQNLSPEERQKRAEERTKKADEMAKMILEPKQLDRLNQLRIQRDGVAALERAEIAEKLGLSKDQKDKIAQLREASRGERGGPGGGGQGGQRGQGGGSQEDREKARAEAQARRDKANADVLAVLTASQKETLEKMQGKKFEFPQQQGRRPGGN